MFCPKEGWSGVRGGRHGAREENRKVESEEGKVAGCRGSVNARVIAAKAGHMRCEVKVNGDK